jgi:hypothetical protein
MTTITQNELTAMLTKYANSDMTKARKYGVVGICQTKIGNLELTYDATSKRYTVTNFNNTSIVLLNPADAGTTRAFIAAAYDVQLKDTVVV